MNARPLIAARLLATSGGAFAKGSERAGAINAGQVGEQANGFLGVHGNVPDRVRAGMEAINIKRRAAYTELAGQRGVAVKDVAATVGCTTLKTPMGSAEAYQLRDGVWRVRQGATPIPQPDDWS
ncbi:MAG: DUF1318 domain-containing protein [Sphingomonas sp.]